MLPWRARHCGRHACQQRCQHMACFCSKPGMRLMLPDGGSASPVAAKVGIALSHPCSVLVPAGLVSRTV
eukprot:349945-Chlamydomonas_euryale.AAC.4